MRDRRISPVFVLIAMLLGCGNTAEQPAAPPPATVAAATPASLAPPEATLRERPATPLAPRTGCAVNPALEEPILAMARDSDGGIWMVDERHAVRRYLLAPEGCVLTRDSSIGGTSLPAFTGAASHDTRRVASDEHGHVFLSTVRSSERWTGNQRDYACEQPFSVVSPAGDRGWLEDIRTLSFSDTGCEPSPWTPPEGVRLVSPLAALRSGVLVANAHVSSEPVPVLLLIDPDGSTRHTRYEGPNVSGGPAAAAFECGARVCLFAMGDILVLDPATLTFDPPSRVFDILGSDAVGTSFAIASLGNGDALFADAVHSDTRESGEPRIVRLHGLPH